VTSWIRRDFDGIGVTQSPPGPHLAAIQRQFGGTVLLCIDVSGSMSGAPLEAAIEGGNEFLSEAASAYYKCGLVLWHHAVDRYVPPTAPHGEVVDALCGAYSTGGNDLLPTLLIAKKLFTELGGNRVLCVFGDGDIGGNPDTVRTARELCAMGVRIVVRGLGRGATESLSRILCPGSPQEDQQVIADVTALAAGIRSMATGLTARRQP
jgi:Mg-chelatase subunit ChlD